MADPPFLVDVGRRGKTKGLLDMIKSIGLSTEAIKTVVISHGHEDHDGGLYEFHQSIRAHFQAHPIYTRLIRSYPDYAPDDVRREFPAGCWRCFMPESFVKDTCPDYHRERRVLDIENIEPGKNKLGTGIHIDHFPGHSPDAIAVFLSDEAVIVGDTVLPDITPIPTREDLYNQLEEVLKPEYSRAEDLYGLKTYIISLKRLKETREKNPELVVHHAHRLFYNGRWNDMELKTRVDELIGHHIERCADILRILQHGPKNAREIARDHFEPNLLEGLGIHMAENEILSHCELLEHSNDVKRLDNGQFENTGQKAFEGMIHAL